MAVRVGVTAGLLGCIGLLDWLTGSEASFSLFYLLPVLTAGILISRRAGFVLSLSGAIVWAAVDILSGHRHTVVWIHTWNTTVRLFFFLITNELACRSLSVYAREREMARTDALTGLANIRVFEERISLVIAQARRDEQPFTLTYVDLDRFKQVNDQFGHLEGDRLLRLVADTIDREIRDTDLAARLGGDEFGILMPYTDESQARTSLQRVASVLDSEIGKSWGIGATFGAVTFIRAPANAHDAIRLADALMYRGKKGEPGGILQRNWPDRTQEKERAPGCS